MINEETIVSVYNDKMTLLQFLKSVNKALDEAVLTSVEVSKKGNATLSFVFEFADGTKIESGEIVLQQGESVTDAKIVDGHLYLTLSNDERLDAGNVKPVTRFEINASQHLIVFYGDGTSQDLGEIFNGNVIVNGTLKQTMPNYTKSFNFSVSNPIFEVTNVYNRFIAINNILYIIANIKIKNTSDQAQVFDKVPTAYVATVDNSEIYNNIYDIEGNTIGNGRANNEIFIAGDQAIILNNGTNALAIRSAKQNYNIVAYNTFSQNKTIDVFFEKTTTDTNITIEAGQSIYLSGRIVLSLI